MVGLLVEPTSSSVTLRTELLSTTAGSRPLNDTPHKELIDGAGFNARDQKNHDILFLAVDRTKRRVDRTRQSNARTSFIARRTSRTHISRRTSYQWPPPRCPSPLPSSPRARLSADPRNHRFADRPRRKPPRRRRAAASRPRRRRSTRFVSASARPAIVYRPRRDSHAASRARAARGVAASPRATARSPRPLPCDRSRGKEKKMRSISHWSPYDRVRVVNAVP